MQDISFTIEKGESVMIHFFQGTVQKTVFVWMENKSKTSVAISDEEDEKYVIEITDNGKINTTKKNGMLQGGK